MIYFLRPDWLTSSPPKCSDSAQTCVQPLPSWAFFFLISCVSYLYLVMLMSNSCGADGRGGEQLAISLDFVAYYSPGAGRNLAAGFMVAAAAAKATRGRRLWFFSWLRVPPICVAHECVPGHRHWLGAPEPPGARNLGVSPLPLVSLATPLLRPPPPLPPTRPQCRKKQPRTLSWISLSLLFGPQMRKTVLPSLSLHRA